jgi:3-hydroxyacyl-CoA dehydrogenase / enoyl-CoA hydratase / 3-hydroxybutyryl-CoA epimerase
MIGTPDAAANWFEPAMTAAFRLDVAAGGLATLTFDSPDRKVNVFDRAALAELEALVGELAGRDDVGCLVLVSAKPGSFIAGADVELIAAVTDADEAEAGVRLGQAIFAAWEALPYPTVAAIAGTCLGGGTELALASTWRVVADRPETRIGLPETRLGIIPAWGGCTRLPRRVGLAAALDLILSGRRISARSALKLGFADALLPAAGFLGYVRDFATAKLGGAAGARRRAAGGGLKGLLLEGNPLGRRIVLDQARKQVLARTRGRYPAPLAALDAVRAGLDGGPRAGFDAEAKAAAGLAVSPTAKNLIHVFQLSERAKKPTAAERGEPRAVAVAAVVGAGTMGGGIGQLIAHETGVPVRLKDIAPAALAGGMAHAARLVAKLVERRRLSAPAARREMALLQPTLDYSGFRRADLVIEAIVEKLPVKQRVFAELAAAVRDDAILASNTSSLSIDAIAGDVPHPERVVGMHFFNPVDKMPLVEVIAGARTSPAAVATVAAFARRLGKTPVPVKDGPGFLVNRLLGFYSVEALQLLGEGYKIDDLDAAMTDWGMPVGPFVLTDEVGVDVAIEVAHVLHAAFADRLPLPAWVDRPVADGRLGRKNGRGFYVYRGGERRSPDPGVYAALGLEPKIAEPDRRYLAERMVLPMVNEAARCLAEGVVAGAGDLDLALIMGTGFPPFRGGLCRWADSEGLDGLIATLERFAATAGERYRPADALRETAAAGGFYPRT